MRDPETAARAHEGHAATSPRRPIDETARLGKEIYERDIRSKVEADHHGMVVVIDVDSGDWAIADTALAASDALRERRPDVVDAWAERVGYRTLRSFGGSSLRRSG